WFTFVPPILSHRRRCCRLGSHAGTRSLRTRPPRVFREKKFRLWKSFCWAGSFHRLSVAGLALRRTVLSNPFALLQTSGRSFLAAIPPLAWTACGSLVLTGQSNRISFGKVEPTTLKN